MLLGRRTREHVIASLLVQRRDGTPVARRVRIVYYEREIGDAMLVAPIQIESEAGRGSTFLLCRHASTRCRQLNGPSIRPLQRLSGPAARRR